MQKNNYEGSLIHVLSIGSLMVTLTLVTGSVTDPINSPKLFILGGVSVGAIFLSLKSGRRLSTRNLALFRLSILGFLGWATLSSLFSQSPLSQNIYGVYGRNTGLLTYFFLGLLALASVTIKDEILTKRLVLGFIFSGAVNLVYGSWVLLFGDFIGWNNQYGSLLGTFGNPNFISSFLGIFFSVVCVFLIHADTKLRLFLSAVLVLTAVQLVNTASLQGTVIAALGVWILIFCLILTKTRKPTYLIAFSLPSMLVGLVSILGAFGVGPLSVYFSQQTLIYRTEYWYAAFKMAMSNPLFGVGMDSYGDWYRFSRSADSLVSPGASVVTNAAHNVILDILSYGGFPLLILYFTINIFALNSVVRYLKNVSKIEPYKIAIIILWLSYHIQSFISINQIGLAIWGWVTTGILIGWFGSDRQFSVNQKKIHPGKLTATQQVVSPNLLLIPGVAIGLILSAPPLAADMKWVTALKSQQVNDLEKSLTKDYFNPLTSARLSQAVQTLEQSNLTDLAVKYARLGVEFNPRNTDSWKMLYYVSKSSPEEKSKAKKALIALDPLNPEWSNLP